MALGQETATSPGADSGRRICYMLAANLGYMADVWKEYKEGMKTSKASQIPSIPSSSMSQAHDLLFLNMSPCPQLRPRFGIHYFVSSRSPPVKPFNLLAARTPSQVFSFNFKSKPLTSFSPLTSTLSLLSSLWPLDSSE